MKTATQQDIERNLISNRFDAALHKDVEMAEMLIYTAGALGYFDLADQLKAKYEAEYSEPLKAVTHISASDTLTKDTLNTLKKLLVNAYHSL